MPVWPFKALMTLSANLSHVSFNDCIRRVRFRPVASKSHGQRSGTCAVLGLNNLITTELDACERSAILSKWPDDGKGSYSRLIKASYLSAGIWNAGVALLKRGTMVSPE